MLHIEFAAKGSHEYVIAQVIVAARPSQFGRILPTFAADLGGVARAGGRPLEWRLGATSA
jgi:hypothetical protein